MDESLHMCGCLRVCGLLDDWACECVECLRACAHVDVCACGGAWARGGVWMCECVGGLWSYGCASVLV